MKTVGSKSIFDFNVVNARQRSNNNDPNLVAVSTFGGFRITGAVSKLLNIASGDNIQFLSTVDSIDIALANKTEKVVKFVSDAGLEYGSPEAIIAVHREFDSWAIAKGIAEYDSKGNLKTAVQRLSKKDKLTYVEQNFDEMLKEALDSEDKDTIDSLKRKGITKEEQSEILSSFVVGKDVPKFKGSKVASPTGITGTGTTLNFSDSNVWKQLKSDLGDDAALVTRTFNLDIDNIQTFTIFNGVEHVEVKGLVLTDFSDKYLSDAEAASENDVEFEEIEEVEFEGE